MGDTVGAVEIGETWDEDLEWHEDLSEYIEFKIFQKNTLADDSDDFPSEKEDTHTNSPLTNPSQADWHRLGALCERLLPREPSRLALGGCSATG